MKNKENGITLVVLVITIILLLILAGITILVLTQTGLLTKAYQAKEVTLNAQNLENETLKDYNNKINSILSNSREQVIIDKEEYETLKKNSEYENYENLEEIIELKPNIKILEGEIKRQGKIVNMQLFVQSPSNLPANVFTEIGILKNDKLMPEIDEWGSLTQFTYGGNFVITKDGIIKIRGATSSTAYIGNITYFSK